MIVVPVVMVAGLPSFFFSFLFFHFTTVNNIKLTLNHETDVPLLICGLLIKLLKIFEVLVLKIDNLFQW